jgi:hypothetical protein
MKPRHEAIRSRRDGEMASGEVLGFGFDTSEEIAAGTPGQSLWVGCTHHADGICRTTGDVIRMSGAVGGGRPRGPSLSRLGFFVSKEYP